MNKTAIIIRGPAGVGKSTVAELLHHKLVRAAHVNIDLFKQMISDESSVERTNIAHDTAMHFTKVLHQHHYNIVVEEIFRSEHLAKWKEFLNSVGYEIHTYFLTAPLPLLIERDATRRIKTKGEAIITKLHEEITPNDGEKVIDMSKLSRELAVDEILSVLD